MNSDCVKIKDQISDLVTGILPEAQVHILEQHLNECAVCRDYARALKDEDMLLTEFFAKIDMNITHQQERVLQAINRSGVSKQSETHLIRRTIMKNPITKVAAVLAVLIGVGAIAVVGVNISKIYYYGKTDDGHHSFISDDHETIVTTDEVTDVEQKVRDLEEIESLRQQDKRELLKVEEILRDGTIAWKVHEYKYELSDGRTSDMREGGDGMPVYSQDQFKEFKPKLEEFRQLKKAGPGEDLGTYDETVEGRVFSFKRERYFLSDGTEIIWSVGTPKDEQ
jgi:Fe2+ or Zn2+ uptake regulation protein